MKTVCNTGIRVSRIYFLFVLSCSIAFSAKAQTYYSIFPSPGPGQYSVSSPSGGICLAPSIANGGNIVSTTPGSYASIAGLLSVTLLCSNDVYSIRSKINFAPSGLTAAPVNSYAGYLIQTNTVLSLSLLKDNMQLITYKAGAAQDTSSRFEILGLDLLSVGMLANISFQTDKEFDEVRLLFNTAVLPVGVAFDYRFFYAFASTTPIILPITLTSFTGAVSGENIQLSWQSASDKNVLKYEVEKMNTQGIFTVIGSLPAKGNANGSFYSFIDSRIENDNNVYRLKIVNSDGAVEYSKMVSVISSANPKWKIYPTILTSGAAINVVVATNNNSSKTQIQLTNLQGQSLRSVAATDSRAVVPTNDLSAGIYIMKLYNNGQLQRQEKIVIQ